MAASINGTPATTTVTSATTSHSVTLPASIAAGETLIVFFAVPSGTASTPSGWTSRFGASGVYIFTRTADATEGGSLSITSSASVKSCAHSYRTTGLFAAMTSETTGTTTPTNADTPGITCGSMHFFAFVAFDVDTNGITTYPGDHSGDTRLAQVTDWNFAVAVTPLMTNISTTEFALDTDANWSSGGFVIYDPAGCGGAIGTSATTGAADTGSAEGTFFSSAVTGTAASTGAADYGAASGTALGTMGSGAKHMKCCCPDCQLTTDNFNRANENPVSGSWSEISGDWGIVSNQLVNVTPGPLITTIQPQPSGRPTNGNYSTKIFFKCVNIGASSVYSIICGYTDASNYDWIRLTADATATTLLLHVEFMRTTAGTPAVLMDISTHPGGIPFTYLNPTSPSSDGYWEGKICYSLNDWTLDATSGATESGGPGIDVHGSETPWTYTGDGGQATLPSGLGNAGFLDGDFDDFAFHMHWEALAKCDYCSCLCKSTEDINEYAQLPEELLVSFIPVFDPADYESDFNDATLLLTQDDGSGNLSPRKFQWKNGSDGTGTPTNLSGRFTCEDNATGAKLGLTVPSACSSMIYGDNDNSSGYTYADIDWAASTCDPLYLVFGTIKAGYTTCEEIPGGGGYTGIMSCFQPGAPGAPICMVDNATNQAFLESLEWLVVVTEPP